MTAPARSRRHRLCELLIDPHRIYASSTRKLMSALEKLLTVSSTVPAMSIAPPKPGSYQARAVPFAPDVWPRTWNGDQPPPEEGCDVYGARLVEADPFDDEG